MIYDKYFASKIYLSPGLCSFVLVCGPCCVMQYFVTFLVPVLSLECLDALTLDGALAVMWLLVSFLSSFLVVLCIGLWSVIVALLIPTNPESINTQHKYIMQ